MFEPFAPAPVADESADVSWPGERAGAGSAAAGGDDDGRGDPSGTATAPAAAGRGGGVADAGGRDAGGTGPSPVAGEAGKAGKAAPAVEALSSAQLLRPVKRAPRSGWRALVHAASGGLINPGESATDRARRELAERANQRLTGCYRVAAVSVKGGVGKTSTTTLLGSAFASLRGDRVIALDANPDRGNLAEKVRSETTATVRHLLADAERIRSSADVRAYTSQSPARLEVLASESDPETSRAFDAGEYQATIDLLSRHYNILLTDCGTGLLHSALQAAVEVADSLLIITSASIDGARAAQATVEWLTAHGHAELVARSVTVITGVRARPGTVDLEAMARYFAAHTREVIRIPFDRHLDEGAEIDPEQLHPHTRDALLSLAAVVADDFPRPTGTPATPDTPGTEAADGTGGAGGGGVVAGLGEGARRRRAAVLRPVAGSQPRPW